MATFKIAAQLYTLRDYCLTKDDLFETLRRLCDMGYDGVELEDTHKAADPAELASFLKKIGFQVCCTRNKYGRTEFDLDGMLREAELYGTPFMGVGTTSCEQTIHAGPDGPLNYGAYMTQLTEKARARGIIPQYDLRSHEFLRDKENGLAFLRSPGTPFPIEKILASTPQDFHFTADSWYVRCASLTVPEVLNLLKGRCDIFRFRDNKITLNELDFYRAQLDPCECGEGVMDIESWLPSLETAGVKWIALGQEFCTKDPFRCMEISLKNVHAMLN